MVQKSHKHNIRSLGNKTQLLCSNMHTKVIFSNKFHLFGTSSLVTFSSVPNGISHSFEEIPKPKEKKNHKSRVSLLLQAFHFGSRDNNTMYMHGSTIHTVRTAAMSGLNFHTD